MQETRFFSCPGCQVKIGVVGTQDGDQWSPPQTAHISGHTEGDQGIVPCSVRGEYQITPNGIGEQIAQQVKASFA